VIPYGQKRYRQDDGMTSGGTDQPTILWDQESARDVLEVYDSGSPATLLDLEFEREAMTRVEIHLNWSSPAQDDGVHPRFTLVWTDTQGGPDKYIPIQARFGMGPELPPVVQDIYLHPVSYLTFDYPSGLTVMAHRLYPVSFTFDTWAPSSTATRGFEVLVKGSSAEYPVNFVRGRQYVLQYKIGTIPPPNPFPV
jgi:hypothetical protein